MKLIVSDVDGTLVEDGTKAFSDGFGKLVIEQRRKNSIYDCVGTQS